MGRSLKEALLGQFAALQEAGLAPTEVPTEDESPMVVVESAPRGRANRSRRESMDRYLESDDDPNGQFDRDRRKLQRRDHRGDELGRERRRPASGPGGGARGRGRGRPGEFEAEFPVPTGGAPLLDRPRGPGGPRPAGPMGPRPGGPMGGRPGMGAPRPGGPMAGGPGRPPSRTTMLQQRAEQRRRDDDDITEMRRLLAEHSAGVEIDEEFMENFSRGLAEETGALPPPHIVVDAIKVAQSADPRKIADAVRAYYRRPRPRAQSGPPQQQPPIATPA